MKNITPVSERDPMQAVIEASFLDTRYFEKNPARVQRIRFPFAGEFYPFSDPPAGSMILVRMARGGQWEREVLPPGSNRQ